MRADRAGRIRVPKAALQVSRWTLGGGHELACVMKGLSVSPSTAP